MVNMLIKVKGTKTGKEAEIPNIIKKSEAMPSLFVIHQNL